MWIASLILLLKIFLFFSVCFFFAGLYKPVISLWFLDRFNRLKVIQIYGSMILISMGIIMLLSKFLLD
jgi:hypothetical protein